MSVLAYQRPVATTPGGKWPVGGGRTDRHLPGRPPVVTSSSGRALEVALAVVTLVTAAGFHRSFRGWGSDWVGPILVTALGGQVVCRLTRRWVRPPLVGAFIDLIAVVVLTIWTVLPSSTAFGVPASGTWHAVEAAIDVTGAQFSAADVPVDPTTSFLLLAVLGTGIMVVTGSWLAFRFGRAMTSVIPAVCCFVVCCIVGTEAGRDWATLLETAAIGGYLLVHRATVSRPRFAVLGAPSQGGASRAGAGGVAMVGVAALCAVVVASSLTGSDGHGPLGWQSINPKHTRVVISPLVSLQTRLLSESSEQVFTVRSSQPSYWALTSLDSFNGYEWNARDTYQDVDRRLAGVSAPTGTRQVTETFRIQNLDSPWLPLAFDPEAVTGAGKVSYDARSGSLLTPKRTSDGMDYTVTSLQYLATLSPQKLASTSPLTHADPPSGYLQLPAVPANVRRLADQIVRGRTTEYAKALALQDYFHGPQFTYSLDPLSDGVGVSTLETFLFDTQTGYCQQFAGAYAVLARLVGLPTRLEVGFTTGTPISGGRYEVTDANAHTWPEVWFPRYGWVPFEPTKGSAGHGFTIPGAIQYTGNTGTPAPGTIQNRTIPSSLTSVPAGTGSGSQPSAGRAESQPGGGAGSAANQAQNQRGNGGSTSLTVRSRHSDDDAAGLAIAFVFGALITGLIVLAGANVLRRRQRWRSRRRRAHRDAAPDAAMILAAWYEVQETLAWHGLNRLSSETPGELTLRAACRSELDPRAPRRGAAAVGLRHLADLATLATFSDEVPSTAPAEAADAAATVRATLRGQSTWAQRFRLLVDPRLSWVEPLGSRLQHPEGWRRFQLPTRRPSWIRPDHQP